MEIRTAQVLLQLLGGYAAFGLLFAVAFAWRGAGVLDPVARNSTWGCRLLIVPGALALWPWLLHRWLGARAGER